MVFQWKTELEEILEVAVDDSDQWVSMLAELLKNYPNNGTINFQLDTNSASFNDLVVELKKLGKFFDTFYLLFDFNFSLISPKTWRQRDPSSGVPLFK